MLDAFLPNDSPAQDPRLCIAFAEDDNDSVLGRNVLGDENGDVGFSFACAERKSDSIKAQVAQTVLDDVSDGS